MGDEEEPAGDKTSFTKAELAEVVPETEPAQGAKLLEEPAGAKTAFTKAELAAVVPETEPAQDAKLLEHDNLGLLFGADSCRSWDIRPGETRRAFVTPHTQEDPGRQLCQQEVR